MSNNESYLRPILDQLSFTFLKLRPTRGSSLLDLILVPLKQFHRVLSYGQTDVAGLDHDIVYCSYSYRSARRPPEYVYQRHLHSTNFDQLLVDAYTWPWENIWDMPDSNDQINFMISSINELYVKHVPVRRTLLTDPSTPWMTQRILKRIEVRNEAYRVWRRTQLSEDRAVFARLRNEVVCLIKDSKKFYFSRKLSPNLPSATLWRNLKSLGVVRGGESVCTGFTVDQHNSYFAGTPIMPVSLPLPDACELDSTSSYSGSFAFSCVSEECVFASIMAIKSKAVGSDGISLMFLRKILLAILPFLTYAFNHCIMTSTFPECWKHALVTPIPKVATPEQLSDFRPISILPVLSKAFEIILKSQIVGYLECSSLLDPLQSGFRDGHSTTTALLKITDDIATEIDESNFTALILLDFSKAFDSLSHMCLLQKLFLLYNFSSSSLRLLHSYLINRTQSVRSEGLLSEAVNLSNGVPQGSVLGPLLFALYINDLPQQIRNCRYHLYADDTQLYISGSPSNLREIFGLLGDDLGRVERWSENNGLALNPGKTQAIFISRRTIQVTLPDLRLCGQRIVFESLVKNLGLTINSRLTWGDHISTIIKKVNYSLHSLRYSRSYTPLSVRLHLAKALVLPLFLYCDVIFCKMEAYVARLLEVAFNSCIRYVYGLGYRARISPYRNSILGCPLFEYYKHRIACQLFKIVHKEAPKYLSDRVTFVSSLRTCHIRYPKHICQQRGDSFFVHGVSAVWNTLPVGLRQLNSYDQFRRASLMYFSEDSCVG